jgi:hypothetical protein
MENERIAAWLRGSFIPRRKCALYKREVAPAVANVAAQLDEIGGDATDPNLPSAGSDFEPVFFMIAARWFSTVRRLIPRSAAMFLLGWPSRTKFRISCCRGVRLALQIANAP